MSYRVASAFAISPLTLEAYDLSHSANLDTSHPKSLKGLKGQLARDEKARQKDKTDAERAKEQMNSLVEVSEDERNDFASISR